MENAEKLGYWNEVEKLSVWNGKDRLIAEGMEKFRGRDAAEKLIELRFRTRRLRDGRSSARGLTANHGPYRAVGGFGEW